jgi:hypothetical protein
MNYRYCVAVMASAAVTATMMISPAAPCAAQNTRTVTLDAGTVIPVKLRDTISSTDSQKGDRFSATLQSEDAARSLRLPIGTIVEGTVSAVRPMEGKEPGVVALKFDRVILPNESSYPIQGSLIGLDNKSVTRGSDGRLTAKSDQKNKTLMYAGYGAGAGLVLGAITRGNTILDTLIGGGLGYLLGTTDKSRGAPRDVLLKPNTEMGVRLDRSITVNYYDDRNSGDRNIDPDLRSRTDRNGDPDRTDRNRNRRDDRGAESGTTRDAGDYRVLNQYTDVRNNGEPIRVFLNGRRISFLSTDRPYFSGGTVMVPAIPVLKADNIRYSSTQSRFIADGPDETFTGAIDSRLATGAGDRRLTLPATIQRRNGTVYVPMQFLALVTGRALSFDRDTQTIEIGSPRSDDSQR